MDILASIYVPGASAVHRCDARAKIVLLLAFSIGIFFVDTWWGTALFAAAAILCLAVARIPLVRLALPLIPVAVLAIVSLAVNSAAGTPAAGALAAARMVLLGLASFAVCFTTTASELLAAFRALLAPLRAVHAPVDDIAVTLALAVRFIPVIAAELQAIRRAQIARGGEGASLRVWGSAFQALFISLFRHADALATAMDARCYGARRELECRF